MKHCLAAWLWAALPMAFAFAQGAGTGAAMLTPEEERVIVYKGTEAPFSGKYYKFNERGTYTCKRCGAALYRSETKFDAGCGWPSFDDEIAGAVARQTDADGMRTEILCARCGGHLGHVFLGEGFTPKNTRHCVNSISMGFVPDGQAGAESGALQVTPPAQETAIFAGGCFWGVEYYLRRHPGVLGTRVGYTGGLTNRPSYKEVCSGRTGHYEAVEVLFDPTKTTYEAVARLFFETHDPEQQNGQGPDIGPQYRSAVFYLNDTQKAVAQKLVQLLRDKGLKVATQLLPATQFWPAETYHQQYYDRQGGAPYCHGYTPRF